MNTVSCRGKPNNMEMSEWLSQYQVYAPLEVSGVYGFMEETSPLYGGRIYSGAEITKKDVEFLKSNSLQLKINLTANTATREEFLKSRELLNAYYYKGNVISVVSDNLATWIKEEYPNYIVEASVIKNTKFSQVSEVLTKYDQVVLPMYMNDDLEKLEKLEDKDRIILFANAGCGYTCKHQICYSSVSKINKGEIPLEEYMCSQSLKPREVFGLKDFDVTKLKELGFNNFKYLTVSQGRAF
jgi:hypothetical protein